MRLEAPAFEKLFTLFHQRIVVLFLRCLRCRQLGGSGFGCIVNLCDAGAQINDGFARFFIVKQAGMC